MHMIEMFLDIEIIFYLLNKADSGRFIYVPWQIRIIFLIVDDANSDEKMFKIFLLIELLITAIVIMTIVNS